MKLEFYLLCFTVGLIYSVWHEFIETNNRRLEDRFIYWVVTFFVGAGFGTILFVICGFIVYLLAFTAKALQY